MAKGARYGFDDSRSQRVWTFVWLNVVAIAAMLVLFFAVLYADATTGAFAAVWAWFSRHPLLMALTAATPLFAGLLVGRASAARAKRRRLAEARRQADEDAARARAARTDPR